MVEECLLVAGLDWIAEQVFAPSVAERDELSVPFDALGADWSNVVVTDAFADGP